MRPVHEFFEIFDDPGLGFLAVLQALGLSFLFYFQMIRQLSGRSLVTQLKEWVLSIPRMMVSLF